MGGSNAKGCDDVVVDASAVVFVDNFDGVAVEKDQDANIVGVESNDKDAKGVGVVEGEGAAIGVPFVEATTAGNSNGVATVPIGAKGVSTRTPDVFETTSCSSFGNESYSGSRHCRPTVSISWAINVLITLSLTIRSSKMLGRDRQPSCFTRSSAITLLTSAGSPTSVGL